MGVMKGIKRKAQRAERRTRESVASMKDSERYTCTMDDGSVLTQTGAEWKRDFKTSRSLARRKPLE